MIKPSESVKPKRSLLSFLRSPSIPLTIVIAIMGLVVASQMGYVKLPRINLGPSNVDTPSATPVGVTTLPATFVGVAYTHDFSDDLIPLLGPEGDPRIFTFYLGSGVGFPPMGLILGIDGVLKGTPTAVGTGTFQVCVKDVGGKSACRKYSLTVTSKSKTKPPPPPPGPVCPTKLNPPCRSVQNGVGAWGGLVPAACDCPSDSTFSSMDNTAPGGPYKICVCK